MPLRTEPRPARPLPVRRGVPGEDGHSVTVDDVRPVLEQIVEAKVPAVVDAVVKLLPPPVKGDPGESIKGEPGRDGTSVDLDDVRPLVLEAVRSLPILKGDPGIKGEPGKDAPLPRGWKFRFIRDDAGFTQEVIATPVT